MLPFETSDNIDGVYDGMVWYGVLQKKTALDLRQLVVRAWWCQRLDGLAIAARPSPNLDCVVFGDNTWGLPSAMQAQIVWREA